ncbi:MAG: 16S rRNA (adenine(1518)-N(6)/adenine(1519)-N(6))-dimethyltransferase RsmA [Armatimonadota bacterium]
MTTHGDSHNSEDAAARLLQMPLEVRTRELMRLYDIRPRRSLSQNFLTAEGAVDQIVSTLLQAASADACHIEIGAGLGALTVPLAQSGRQVVAFETDEALIEPLTLLMRPFENVAVRHADVTEVNLGSLASDRALAIVGNLPYHLSGLLLRQLMEAGRGCEVIVVTAQTEVAERLAAGPGEEQYGMLSVFAAYYLADIAPICDIGPGAFHPQPTVDSTALRLTPVQRGEEFPGGRPPEQRPMLAETIRAAFGHRRKTLRNALALGLQQVEKSDITEALLAADVDSSLRAEKLDIHDFSRIAGELARITGEVGSDA